MSGMKDKASGDYAPSRSPYMDIGRFRLTAMSTISGSVWIRDLETGEGGAFGLDKLEAKIRDLYKEEF